MYIVQSLCLLEIVARDACGKLFQLKKNLNANQVLEHPETIPEE